MTGLDWGTVPTWISSLLTGGSLLLGFHILLRDRKKEERSEGLKVVCWHEYDSDISGTWTVHVLNTADRPITYPRVITRFSIASSVFLEPFSIGAILPAGEELTWTSGPREPGAPKVSAVGIEFTDADGAEWVRDLDTRELHRRRCQRLTSLKNRPFWIKEVLMPWGRLARQSSLKQGSLKHW
ncbi:hypothetical protein [Streptomyces tsukubensis]|uniref:hypothetical protein n=1 Tax=Streptomyces tsukubensis TaxID=83656 RepID=UPI00344EE69B